MIGLKIAFLDGRRGDLQHDNGTYVEEGRPKGIDVGVVTIPVGAV
jgi:hypothetical protein